MKFLEAENVQTMMGSNKNFVDFEISDIQNREKLEYKCSLKTLTAFKRLLNVNFSRFWKY